jgi:hypothetical protein
VRRPGPGWAGGGIGALLGAVVCAPLFLGRGFVLSYDMVFVPRLAFTPAVWGTDGAVPRAVPSDFVVAVLSTVLPGELVQRLLLVVVFPLAGAGLGLLLRRWGPLPVAVAVVTYLWNPWVYERLVLGHWPFLLGHAVLPWVVVAADRVRQGSRGGLAGLACWLVAGALPGATTAVLTGGLAAALVGWPGGAHRRRRALPALALVWAAVGAAWWLPTLTRAGGVPADPAGVDAFAARGETAAGAVPSLLSGAGGWNLATVPPGRTAFAVGLSAVLALGVVLAVAVPWWRAGERRALVVAGVASLVLSAAGALPVLHDVLTAVVLGVPGGGLLRDGQKLLGPWLVLVALCAGEAAARLAGWRAGPGWRPGAAPAVAAVLLVVPVALLPALAWGALGRLAPVPYPAEWAAARAVVADGTAAVLPWRQYRRFAWNGDRVVLDPMPRYLAGPALTADDLPLSSGVVVRGEDPRSARVGAALAGGKLVLPVLADLGVRWVVVHRDQPGSAQAEAAVAGATVRFRGPELVVAEVPGAVAPRPRGRFPWGMAVTLASAIGVIIWRFSPRPRRPLLRSAPPEQW